MSQVKTLVKVALVAIFASGTLQAQGSDDASSNAAVFVQTLDLAAQTPQMQRQFFGKVAALKTVDISFEVGGYVTLLEAREGARIPEGTLLARLDVAPFDRAVVRAELALAQAERDLIRANELATRNVGSQVQADNAQTARDLAKVALAEARDARSDAEIRAPFDGLVADRIGTAFTTVEPGQPIIRLHNMSEVRVEFDLPERLLAQIGDPGDVRFAGLLAGQDAPLQLAFREFRTETNGVGQSYTISLAVNDVQAATLLPGRTITVQATMATTPGLITVPATAVRTEPDGTHLVFTIVTQNDTLVARRNEVELTSQNGTTFELTGISPENEIVAVGAHLLTDGQPVRRYTGLTVEGL